MGTAGRARAAHSAVRVGSRASATERSEASSHPDGAGARLLPRIPVLRAGVTRSASALKGRERVTRRPRGSLPARCRTPDALGQD